MMWLCTARCLRHGQLEGEILRVTSYVKPEITASNVNIVVNHDCSSSEGTFDPYDVTQALPPRSDI